MKKSLDRVLITHPDVDGIGGPVTRASFESLWEAKGWRIVDDTAAAKKTSRRTPRAAPTEEG